MDQQVLAVASRHSQKSHVLARPPRVKQQTAVLLRHILLLDPHGVDIVAHRRTAHASALSVHAAVRRISLLFQYHVCRRQVLHHRVGSQPGEAGHRGKVAEHHHAGAEAGVHASVGAQEFIGEFVLNDAHGGAGRQDYRVAKNIILWKKTAEGLSSNIPKSAHNPSGINCLRRENNGRNRSHVLGFQHWMLSQIITGDLQKGDYVRRGKSSRASPHKTPCG